MLRSACLFFLAVVLLLVGAELLWAQPNTWPDYPSDPADLHRIDRGPGSYLSWLKIAALVALYFVWVKTTDWANRDSQILQLPYYIWNLVLFIPFFVGLLLALTIPVSAWFSETASL